MKKFNTEKALSAYRETGDWAKFRSVAAFANWLAEEIEQDMECEEEHIDFTLEKEHEDGLHSFRGKAQRINKYLSDEE